MAIQWKIIIWYEVINNIFSEDRCNRTTVPTEELKKTLKTFRDRIKAIVYFRRERTIGIWNKLIKRKIPMVKVKKQMLSHKQQKDDDPLGTRSNSPVV